MSESKKAENLLDQFSDNPLTPGKIPPGVLERLLNLPRRTNPALLVGPGPGEDAALLRLRERRVVVSSDPITFRTPRPGYYAVHINANDIAAMGASPEFFTLTLIMPPQSTEKEIAKIWIDAVDAADTLQAVLVGGHSEISTAVITAVISVTMFGKLIKDRPFKTGDGLPGDAIIQVGPMGIEGTSILASENKSSLEQEFGPDFTELAAGFLFDPGLSVVTPASLAAENLDVRAMHDPTEGGLATGLIEIALASGTGLVVSEEKLLLRPETLKICRFLKYDPLGLISSGCLLFTVEAKEADKAVQLMEEAGFASACIGRLTENKEQYFLEDRTGMRSKLPMFAVDELAAGALRK